MSDKTGVMAYSRQKLVDNMSDMKRSKLWLYASLLDHPDPKTVFLAARNIIEGYTERGIDRALWARAKRRLAKFKWDKQTGEMLAVDPLYRLRGGCKPGRPSKVELDKAQEESWVYELAELMDKVESGEWEGE